MAIAVPDTSSVDTGRVRATQKLLPALLHHVSHYPCPPSSLVLLTHVLDTAVPFVQAVAETTKLEAVVGIPYSTMPTAHAQMVRDGRRVLIPDDLVGLPELARHEILSASRRTNSPVVLQEIGGYCADLVDELVHANAISGVVEDTKQGHWRYASQASLPCPVLSIAESPLKALENQQVGRAISHALESILRRYFHRLMRETRVGILGYGGIGEATAGALAALGARVAVFDTCGIRMAKAALDGHGHLQRDEILRTSDVVLGVSGYCSIKTPDFDLLRPGVFLASGSSKQVEIDLATLSERGSIIEDDGIVKEYDIDGKSVILLNDGMPINFLEQSILGRVLDLVYTELYMCVREIALGNAPTGLTELDIAQQREIAETWRALHWIRA
jgi:adenosylhomocysteinase